MTVPVAQSRRALFAASAALAAAPVAAAKKKGKKKKKPAPLAYAVARVTQLDRNLAVLLITFEGEVLHVASGNAGGFTPLPVEIPFATAGTALVSEIQSAAARSLSIGYELTVPEERIAVTLL